MRGYPGYVSNRPRQGGGNRLLICGVNWVGDSVMTMPALQALRRDRPDAHITILVKKAMAPLWRCHDAPNDVLAYDDTNEGTWKAVSDVRAVNADVAFVLPNSFRSALIPFLAGIPERLGVPGHGRRFLLTNVVETGTISDRRHQAYEYIDLLVPERSAEPLLPPRLRPSSEAVAAAEKIMNTISRPRIGLLPGAARGPSKRWPAGHFAEVGRRLVRERSCGVALFGSSGETELCAGVAADIGAGAVNLAGRTSLPDLIALLAACDAVVTNDSGGMHLASAVGTSVVAIYGMTDPSLTGPLGPASRIVQDSDTKSRDIPRDSNEAQKRLAAISPDKVYAAVLEFLRS